MNRMAKEKFDFVYNRLKGFYGVMRIHSEEEMRPIKFFHQDGAVYALRWSPEWDNKPTPEQFAMAHGIEIYDGNG